MTGTPNVTQSSKFMCMALLSRTHSSHSSYVRITEPLMSTQMQDRSGCYLRVHSDLKGAVQRVDQESRCHAMSPFGQSTNSDANER